MLRFAVAVRKPSLTCRTIVLLPVEIEQLAAMSAFTVPLVLVMLEIVRPVGTVVAVTVRLPALLSASLTVAMVVLAAADPCTRALPTGVMDGAVFGLHGEVQTGVSVVILSVQPPAIVPESPVAPSSTYRLQVPFGFVPLKTDNVWP